MAFFRQPFTTNWTNKVFGLRPKWGLYWLHASVMNESMADGAQSPVLSEERCPQPGHPYLLIPSCSVSCLETSGLPHFGHTTHLACTSAWHFGQASELFSSSPYLLSVIIELGIVY
jgi:hypothetical protein